MPTEIDHSLRSSISRFFQPRWTEKRLRFWRANRQFGRWRWILNHGVVGFGSLFFIFTIAREVFINGRIEIGRIDIIRRLCLCLIAGLLWGLWMWNSMDRSYLKFMEKEQGGESSS
jgi:hypothetical protein